MKEEYSSYKFSEDFHLISDNKKLGYEMIEAVLSFVCFYPLLAFIIFLVNQSKDDVLDGLLLLIPILVMVYIKKKVKNSALFVIAELLAAAVGTVFLWAENLIPYHFIFLLCFAIYFIIKRVKNRNAYWRFANLAAMNILLAFIYGFTLINNVEMIRKLVFTFALLHILISIIYFHFSSTNKLLQWEKYSDDKHARNMKAVNVMFSILIVIIIGGVIVMLYQGTVFHWLDALNRRIYSGIFKAVDLAQTSPKDYMDMEQTPIFDMHQLEGLNAPVNNSMFFKIFVMFIKVIFFVIIAIDLIAMAAYLLPMIYRKFTRKANTDEKVESTLSAKEALDSLKRSFKRPVNSLRKAVFKTNKEKLRRLYFHAVMEYKKKGASVEVFNTPNEIEESIISKHNVRIKNITDIYERFRYTSQEPTDNDLEVLKKNILSANKKR